METKARLLHVLRGGVQVLARFIVAVIAIAVVSSGKGINESGAAREKV